jgi:hypothetical protein
MRFAGAIASLLLTVGCAAGTAATGDGGGPPPPDAPPLGRADADHMQPDAGPKPPPPIVDADLVPPPPDAMPPPPPPIDAPPPPPPIDAAPGSPDAPPPPPLPDAAPPPVCSWVNVLGDPAFDSGGVWAETSAGGYTIIGAPPSGVTPLSAPNIAWMGGYDNGDDTLVQTVTIPAGATMLHLKGSYIIGTSETLPFAYDYVYFRLRDTGGTVLENLGQKTNVDAIGAWTAMDFPAASAHAGATLQVFIEATTDLSNSTGFLLDNMSLEAYVCM